MTLAESALISFQYWTDFMDGVKSPCVAFLYIERGGGCVKWDNESGVPILASSIDFSSHLVQHRLGLIVLITVSSGLDLGLIVLITIKSLPGLRIMG